MAEYKLNCTGEELEERLAKPIPYEYMPEGYPKVVDDEVLSAENVTFTLNEYAGAYTPVNPFSGTLVVGEKYTVVWDGVKYKDLVAFAGDYGIVKVGAADEDSFTEEMPFMVTAFDGLCVPVTNSTAATHSITITQEKITPIAKKFLPEDIGGGIKYCVFGMDENDNYTSSMTYDEISAAMLSGTMVVGVYGSRLLYPAGGSFMSDISTYQSSSDVVFSHNVTYDYGQEIFSFSVNEDGSVEYFAPQVNS